MVMATPVMEDFEVVVTSLADLSLLAPSPPEKDIVEEEEEGDSVVAVVGALSVVEAEEHTTVGVLTTNALPGSNPV